VAGLERPLFARTHEFDGLISMTPVLDR